MFSGIQRLISDPIGYLLSILYMLPGIIVGFTIHEFCHAAAAVALGDATPRQQGRLTLNPGAHVDWVGLLMMVLLGFGWAKPVQVTPRNFRHPKRDDVLVSLAGPLSNLLLAVIFFPLMLFIDNPIAQKFIASAYQINLLLFFLNMLPLPPLDGYQVVKSLLANGRTLEKFWAIERFGILFLLIFSMLGWLGRYLGWGIGIVTQLLTRLLF